MSTPIYENETRSLPDFIPLLGIGLNANKLNFKDQCGIPRDHTPGAAGTIAKRRWDDQVALAANLHPIKPFVPAFDDLTGPEGELNGLAAPM
mmetsp:Transcript_17659/g.41577  ORF Transcript_17659/g.41577 Transcript_17659/m.41577 type:complete len:92 (+) Transcript_17659:45-320(+)